MFATDFSEMRMSLHFFKIKIKTELILKSYFTIVQLLLNKERNLTNLNHIMQKANMMYLSSMAKNSQRTQSVDDIKTKITMGTAVALILQYSEVKYELQKNKKINKLTSGH